MVMLLPLLCLQNRIQKSANHHKMGFLFLGHGNLGVVLLMLLLCMGELCNHANIQAYEVSGGKREAESVL